MLHGVSSRSSLTISGVTARDPGDLGNKGIPLRSAGVCSAGSTARRSNPETTIPSGFLSWIASIFAISSTSASRFKVVLILKTSRITSQVWALSIGSYRCACASPPGVGVSNRCLKLPESVCQARGVFLFFPTSAARFLLSFCVIEDHGGGHHVLCGQNLSEIQTEGRHEKKVEELT
jgi:hypothetical protein